MNEKFGKLAISQIEQNYIQMCIFISFTEFSRFVVSDYFRRSLSFFSYSCVFKDKQLVPGKRFACGSVYGMFFLRHYLLEVLRDRGIGDIREPGTDYLGIGWEQTELKRTFRVYLIYSDYNLLHQKWKLDYKYKNTKDFIREGLISITYSENGNNPEEYKIYRYDNKSREALLFSSTRIGPIHQKNNCARLPPEIRQNVIVQEMKKCGYEVDTWAENENILKIYWPKLPICNLVETFLSIN